MTQPLAPQPSQPFASGDLDPNVLETPTFIDHESLPFIERLANGDSIAFNVPEENERGLVRHEDIGTVDGETVVFEPVADVILGKNEQRGNTLRIGYATQLGPTYKEARHDIKQHGLVAAIRVSDEEGNRELVVFPLADGTKIEAGRNEANEGVVSSGVSRKHCDFGVAVDEKGQRKIILKNHSPINGTIVRTRGTDF